MRVIRYIIVPIYYDVSFLLFSEFVTTIKSSNLATRNTITITSFSGHSTTDENVKHTTNVMTSMSNKGNKGNVLKKQNSRSTGKTV